MKRILRLQLFVYLPIGNPKLVLSQVEVSKIENGWGLLLSLSRSQCVELWPRPSSRRKSPRIGYSSGSHVLFHDHLPHSTPFREGSCASSAISRGKTLSSNTDLAEGKPDRMKELAAELQASQGRPYRFQSARFGGIHAPSKLALDSDCHGIKDSDPIRNWIRRHPRSAGRQHHWIIDPRTGVSWVKTTGASKGNRS